MSTFATIGLTLLAISSIAAFAFGMLMTAASAMSDCSDDSSANAGCLAMLLGAVGIIATIALCFV